MVNVGGGKKSSVVSGLHYRLFYALYLYENSCISNHSMLQETMANRTGQQSIIRYRYGLFHRQIQVWFVSLSGTGMVCFIVRYRYSPIQVWSVSLSDTGTVCSRSKFTGPYHVVPLTRQSSLTYTPDYSHLHTTSCLTCTPDNSYQHTSPVSPTHQPCVTHTSAQSHLLTSPVTPSCKLCLTWKFELHVFVLGES